MPSVVPNSRRLYVDARTLVPQDLGSIREVWEALEQQSVLSPYLAFGWLESWAEIYRPSELVFLRITDGDGAPIGLGLLERRRFGVLQFAGGPVTPVRGLACAPVDEQACWTALGEWLARASPTRMSAVAARDCWLPGATSVPAPWYGLDLPETFEAYIQQRPANRRREIRRRLRVAEREGVVTSLCDGVEASAGVAAFVELHAARARAKGERHRLIDERLGRLLARVAERGDPVLRVSTARQGDRTIGVGIQLDAPGTTWAYNTGFAPAAAQLSPGLLVRVASIRDAIERGQRTFDLGPGAFSYKVDLGGVAFARPRLEYTSRAPAGRIARVTIRSAHELRQMERLRAAVNWWRGRRRQQDELRRGRQP